MRKPSEFDNHPMPYEPHAMRGICRYIVDGDTVDVFVDEGLYDYAYITVRIKDYNAPELNGPTEAEKLHAQEARAYAMSLIYGHPVRVLTFKDRQTFGRFVADIHYWSEGVITDFASTMRLAGMERRESYAP